MLLQNHGHPLTYPIHPVLYLPKGCSSTHEIMLWCSYVVSARFSGCVAGGFTMRTWLMPAEVLFFCPLLLCPCDTLCFCAKGHTWSGAVSRTCNIIVCPVCGLLRANSYPCWALRSGIGCAVPGGFLQCCAPFFPSSKWAAIPGNSPYRCPNTILVQLPCKSVHTEICPVRMFPLQKPPWPWALTRLPPSPHSSCSAASGSLLEEKPLKSWQNWYGEATHYVAARGHMQTPFLLCWRPDLFLNGSRDCRKMGKVKCLEVLQYLAGRKTMHSCYQSASKPLPAIRSLLTWVQNKFRASDSPCPADTACDRR